MSAVSEAVVLTAGEGSRLRGSDKTFLKPFVPVLGRPLISYALDALTRAGIKTVHFVVGYESERMIAQLKPLVPSGVSASFIENPDWRKQNGISLLAAVGHVGAPFLLTMSDHLFDDAIIGCLLENFDPGLLNIALDRKLDSVWPLQRRSASRIRASDNRLRNVCVDSRCVCARAASRAGSFEMADGSGHLASRASRFQAMGACDERRARALSQVRIQRAETSGAVDGKA